MKNKMYSSTKLLFSDYFYSAFFLLLFFSETGLCQVKTEHARKPVSYFNPVWSPSGASIVFESTMDGKSSIYTISPDGTELKKITDTLYNYGQPGWSPDGKFLVYYGSQHPMQLFIIAAVGGSEKQLTMPVDDAYEPSWSVENKIAFTSRPIGQTPNDLSVIHADGTALVKLTDGVYDYASPKWSPDGKKILFERSIAVKKPWNEISKSEREQMKDSAEILIMNSDGSGIRNITNNAIREKAPCWSHDGRTVYFLSEKDSGMVLRSLKLHEMKAHDMLRLSGMVYCVSISPDEKYAVYAAEREKKYAIYIWDIRKKKERKLIGD